MAISVKVKGDFKNTERFFENVRKKSYFSKLERYAQEGVDALKNATPVDTGLTANSWSYEIIKTDGYVKITWNNSNRVDGVPIAIILEYGHVTRNGGYVAGRNYIGPAIRPIFDKIADNVWKEVKSS